MTMQPRLQVRSLCSFNELQGRMKGTCTVLQQGKEEYIIEHLLQGREGRVLSLQAAAIRTPRGRPFASQLRSWTSWTRCGATNNCLAIPAWHLGMYVLWKKTMQGKREVFFHSSSHPTMLVLHLLQSAESGHALSDP